MVAIEPKSRDMDGAVLSLRSISSLTSAEYLRFNLVCSAAVLPAVWLLVQNGRYGTETETLLGLSHRVESRGSRVEGRVCRV